MKPTLKLFRNLLPFSEPPARKRAGEVGELLDTVCGPSAHQVVTELTERVIPAIAERKNFHMRFKLPEEALQEAEKTLSVFERHVDLSSLPPPRAATNPALAADNLLKALVASYLKVARTILQGSQQESLIGIFQRAAHRAVMLLKRRQQLACRSCARPSGSTWPMLHALRRAIGGRAACRFNRRAFKPYSDLVGGIAHVIPFIGGDAHSPRGIHLQRLPGYGHRPGIIARPGHLASGHEVESGASGDTRLWQIGRRLEASEGLELFAPAPL